MTKRERKLNRIYPILALIILIGGAIFWASDLSSDPPMYYSGLGQSLSTDPAQYVYHSRNEVLFGKFDPFDYPRWTVYQHSLISLVSFVWFKLFGVSMTQAAGVAILMTFLSFIFLLLAVRRYHSNWTLAAVAFCCVINVTLFTYGRLTYLEIGLLLIISILFYAFTRIGDRIYGLAICGFLAAAGMLTGKLFGALLLPTLLMVILFSFTENKIKRLLVVTGSFALSSLVLILLLYGTNLSAAFSYIGEQSYGLRGFPEGLSSPNGFVEHFISYGFSNRLFYLDPDILIFAVGLLFLVAIFRSSGIHFRDLSPVARIASVWTLVAFLGLMPLNYSPVRYAVIMLPAIIAAFFAVCDQWRSRRVVTSFKFDRGSQLLLLFGFWLLGFHLFMNSFYFNTFPSPAATVVWVMLPFAALFAFGTVKLLQLHPEILSSRNLKILLVLVLVSSAIFNTSRIRQHHFLDHNFNILEANRDVAQILTEGAVLSGPYAPTLTMNNDVKSFIHLFGVADVDSTLFDRYPITHLAVDSSNWALAVKDYPKLASLQPITSYWIRDYEVALYDISQIFNNPTARQYHASNYELALTSLKNNQIDSAEVQLRDFMAANPDSKSGGILMVDLMSSRQDFEQVQAILSSLANRYPTDFFLQLQTGRLLQILAYHNKDNSLLSLSKFYYERGVKVNKYKADLANRMFSQTMQQLQSQTSP